MLPSGVTSWTHVGLPLVLFSFTSASGKLSNKCQDINPPLNRASGGSQRKGRTLATIRARLPEQGADKVLVAAFALKERGQPAAIAADFVGVRVPDRFVFGFGMDVAGVWRNLPAIRALRETQD